MVKNFECLDFRLMNLKFLCLVSIFAPKFEK